jgi:hypothetical protein
MIKVIFLILCVCFLTFPIYTIFSSIIRGKKVKIWATYNKQLLKWAEEIEDIDNRLLFLIDVSIWTFGDVKGLKDKKKFEETILSKYVKHIPSIKQNNRDKKINEILK